MDPFDTNEMKEKENRLLRKIDFKIVPFMLLLYLLSFLDRVNIGNAKLAHLERDLGLVGSEFNWSLSIFFIGYVVFEIPSNLVLYKVRPSIWLPTIMIAWGITMSLMAFVKSYAELLITRFFLGVFEAGLVPGIVYYITLWYRRYDQSFRMGVILSGSSIAGAFSGLLTYAIVSLTNDDSPLKGWQLIFLIDGLVTVIVAIIAYFYIADYPEEAKWLRKEERSLAVLRLKRDIDGIEYKKAREHSFDKVYIVECLTDWKVYISMLILLGINTSVYSFAFYIPSIVNGFGFDEGKMSLRGPFIMSFASIATVGYIVILYSINMNSMIVKYIATCIIAIGASPCGVLTIIWLSNNLSPPLKCNIGVAMMISCGNCGGIIAAQIYRSVDYPNYERGHIIASCFLLAAICLCAIQYGTLIRLNELKEEKKLSIKTSGYKGIEEDKKILSDRHYKFEYSL
ncbi:19957_t:CDS:10 [Cetraspora pellucida]|uniref:19957_t:CDS:1 n=1 Tax=Cetraspora pellucida TaxID=1433469 RepID=A0A9N9HDH6_9GLOM|nr:19957_t:CDS:10 [Cetraspora pellucida]